jgi:chemotaxis protein methyltransferase CheR
MFRDPLFFLSLRRRFLPLLQPYASVRVWIAGCSSGEEVYSVAILLLEEGLANCTEIYATDMNPEGLQQAQKGTYPLAVMQKYTRNYLESGGRTAFSNYYTASSLGATFHADLRDHVVFAQHNLVTDHAFQSFHLILCRNVLIYFDGVLQKQVLRLFHDSLLAGGFLGLGNAESLTISDVRDAYECIDPQQKLYRKITSHQPRGGY